MRICCGHCSFLTLTQYPLPSLALKNLSNPLGLLPGRYSPGRACIRYVAPCIRASPASTAKTGRLPEMGSRHPRSCPPVPPWAARTACPYPGGKAPPPFAVFPAVPGSGAAAVWAAAAETAPRKSAAQGRRVSPLAAPCRIGASPVPEIAALSPPLPAPSALFSLQSRP